MKKNLIEALKKKRKIRNCKKGHKANDKRYIIYNRYLDMNKVVAENRNSTYKCKKKIMRKEKSIYRDKRRSEDGNQCTKRTEINKKGNENGKIRSCSKVIRFENKKR